MGHKNRHINIEYKKKTALSCLFFEFEFLIYTDTEQVCNFETSVPIGITESNRKMRCIFSKIQYNWKSRTISLSDCAAYSPCIILLLI